MKPRKATGAPRCVICGTARNIEHHHIGGQNHLGWITAPLCRSHHNQCHVLLGNAGVDLNYTDDPLKRLMRASKAMLIFQCLLYDAMDHIRAARGAP